MQTTPELALPLLTTTPHQREDVSALDRFSVHRCPTLRVFCGTGLELVTKPATIRHLYHLATAATPPCNRKLHEIWNFSERLAQPIRSFLLSSMITFTVALHLLVIYEIEARFASHMPSNNTVGL
ncbi:uncharacterized protein TNCV_3777601 [Trichonephila clavipes]|nr:uncharacterized protein TNCV_3777601 [Trichonephila clavipes]